jgi:hypothetical protein
MATQPRLSARFPVGTRYIVEGEPLKGGKLKIVSRYLVMPSGVRYDLMNAAEPARMSNLPRKPRVLRSAPRRLIFALHGALPCIWAPVYGPWLKISLPTVDCADST